MGPNSILEDVRHPNAARYERGITEALQRFDDVESGRDGDAIWNRTAEVLAALYRAEQAEVAHDRAYWDEREASDSGRVLAGLMFFRAFVEHEGIEVQELAWHDAAAKIRHEGEWRDAQIKIFQDGHWRNAAARIARAGWPSLPSYEEKRSGRQPGRGVLYRDYVEGRRLKETLHEAARFLLAR